MIFINSISYYIIPIVLLLIISIALFKKIPSFNLFVDGAKNGLLSTYKIAPSLIGLVVAVNMLKSSGALDILSQILNPVLSPLGFPPELVPLALLKPFSGGGATAILNDILNSYGPDSFIGTVASVMAGSTETTFYAITVYYGSVGIKNTRHTLPCALLADIAGIIMALLTTRLILFS